MRRPLIRKRDCAASLDFASGFTFHQKSEPSLNDRQFRLLPRHDFRQILDRAGEMGDLFFQVRYICHGPYQRAGRAFCKSWVMSFLAKMKVGAGSHHNSALLL